MEDVVYLLVISEDAEVPEEERIKIKNEQVYKFTKNKEVPEEEQIKIKDKQGYKFIKNKNEMACICVLIHHDKNEIDQKSISINNMLQSLKELNKKVVYINCYHDNKKLCWKKLLSYAEMSEIPIKTKRRRYIKFSHTEGDSLYRAIKEIMSHLESGKEGEIIEIIKNRILYKPKEALKESNKRKLIYVLREIKQKMDNENFTKAIEIIVEEILKEEELLKDTGRIMFEAMEKGLNKENKKAIKACDKLIEALLKISKVVNDADKNRRCRIFL